MSFLCGDLEANTQTGLVSQSLSQSPHRAELMKFTSQIEACFSPELSKSPGLREAGGPEWGTKRRHTPDAKVGNRQGQGLQPVEVKPKRRKQGLQTPGNQEWR